MLLRIGGFAARLSFQDALWCDLVPDRWQGNGGRGFDVGPKGHPFEVAREMDVPSGGGGLRFKLLALGTVAHDNEGNPFVRGGIDQYVDALLCR